MTIKTTSKEAIRSQVKELHELIIDRNIFIINEIDVSSYETETVYHNKNWKCSIYDEENDKEIDIPLVYVAQSTDMYEATGEDKFKDYPIAFEIGILNKECHVSISEDMSDETKEELGLESSDLHDVLGYCGMATYMSQRFLETDAINQNILADLSITGAALFSYKCRFTGETKEYPRFKTHQEASHFMLHLIHNYGNMFMRLIGFELDRPVNLVGETGWKTIEMLHFGINQDKKKAV